MAEVPLTLNERIAELEKKVEELTQAWNTAQINRDLIATKHTEEQLIIAQTELNALLMRRKV